MYLSNEKFAVTASSSTRRTWIEILTQPSRPTDLLVVLHTEDVD